jgi:hypothetical protein
MGTFYIKKPELAYVHIPRTGMGMKMIIKDYLKPRYDVIDYEPWQIDHPNLNTVYSHYPKSKTVTVIRNPWQRVHSFYKKISTEGYWLDWNGKTLMDLKPFDQWLEDYGNPEVIFEFPRWFNRFTNMVDFIQDGDSRVDFVLKSEQLEQDFEPVKEYLQCNDPLPDISNTFNHYEYRSYYSSRGAAIIQKIHERDCDIFKYVF